MAQSINDAEYDTARGRMHAHAQGGPCAGVPRQDAGYDAVELAHRLRIDILPVLGFLAEHGRLPVLMGRAMIAPGEPMGSPDDQAGLPAAPSVVHADATGAGLALSGGFFG